MLTIPKRQYEDLQDELRQYKEWHDASIGQSLKYQRLESELEALQRKYNQLMEVYNRSVGVKTFDNILHTS